MDKERLQQITAPLLTWFAEHARDLPWRIRPTAYRVWVSEIMLQQTRVEAVKPFYMRFMEALPDVTDLAACPEDRLLKSLGRTWLLQPRPEYAKGGPDDL